MDIAEYKDRVKQLEEKLDTDRAELMKQFVRDNNPYKVGDIITDHIGSIKIEKMGYSWGYGKPCATYYGIELKKDGTPNKRNSSRWAFQSNLSHQ
jgi:hypothetical protein